MSALLFWAALSCVAYLPLQCPQNQSYRINRRKYGGILGESDAEEGRVIRSPPPADVVRSGRGSAFWPCPGFKVCEQARGSQSPNSSAASLGCCSCRERSAVPCWPAPGGNPGECAPGLRRAGGRCPGAPPCQIPAAVPRAPLAGGPFL